jgi:hypothetical protein
MNKIMIAIATICGIYLNVNAQTYECQFRIYGYENTNNLKDAVKSIEENIVYYEIKKDSIVLMPTPVGYGRTIWQFDKTKNVTEHIVNNERDSLIEHHIYTYANNKLVEAKTHNEYYNWEREYGGNLYEKTMYHYDTLGQIQWTKYGNRKANDTITDFLEPLNYHYTPENLLAFQDYAKHNFKVVYTYDNKQNKTKEMHYTDKTQTSNCNMYNYKYDSNNRMIEKELIQENILQEKYQYAYTKNNLQKWARQYACEDYGNWDFTAYFTYNKNGDIINTICKHTIPQVETTNYTYTYEYDSQKNWIKRTEIFENRVKKVVTRKINYYE